MPLRTGLRSGLERFPEFIFISISSGLSIRCVKFVLSVIYLLEFKMVNDLEP